MNYAAPRNKYQEENAMIKAHEEGLRNLSAIPSLRLCLRCVLRCHWSRRTQVDFGGTGAAAYGALSALGRLACWDFIAVQPGTGIFVHVAILASRLQLEKTFESVIPNTRNSLICKVSGECLHYNP